MRAKEFIAEESKLRKGVRKAIPNLATWPELDNGNVPYLQYRFGVACAGSPDQIIDSAGPIRGQLTTISYTPAEEEILKGAAKSLGVTPVRGSGTKSQESDSVNKSSPVAKPKKNKYGV